MIIITAENSDIALTEWQEHSQVLQKYNLSLASQKFCGAGMIIVPLQIEILSVSNRLGEDCVWISNIFASK